LKCCNVVGREKLGTKTERQEWGRRISTWISKRRREEKKDLRNAVQQEQWQKKKEHERSEGKRRRGGPLREKLGKKVMGIWVKPNP